MASRRTAVVLALAVVMGTMVLLWLAIRGGDEAPAEEVGPTDLELAALDESARELVALAAKGRARAYHATYEQGDGARYEVWIDGPRAREEVRTAAGYRRLVIQTAIATVRCDPEGGGWSCAEAGEGEGEMPRRLDRLLADLAGAGVTATTATIAGAPARCFAVTGPEGPLEICLTNEGVPARLVSDNERIELKALDDRIDATVFAVPSD